MRENAKPFVFKWIFLGIRKILRNVEYSYLHLFWKGSLENIRKTLPVFPGNIFLFCATLSSRQFLKEKWVDSSLPPPTFPNLPVGNAGSVSWWLQLNAPTLIRRWKGGGGDPCLLYWPKYTDLTKMSDSYNNVFRFTFLPIILAHSFQPRWV